MNNIAVTVSGQQLTAVPDAPLTTGTAGQVTFSVDPDSSWDGLNTLIVFRNGDIERQLMIGQTNEVPEEVLAAPGRLWITIMGTGANRLLRTLVMKSPLRVWPSNGGVDPAGRTKEAWEYVLDKLTTIEDGLNTIDEKVAAAQTALVDAETARTESATALEAATSAKTAAETASANAQTLLDSVNTLLADVEGKKLVFNEDGTVTWATAE